MWILSVNENRTSLLMTRDFSIPAEDTKQNIIDSTLRGLVMVYIQRVS